MNRQGIYVNGKKVYDSQGKDIHSIECFGNHIHTVVGINKGSISVASHNNKLVVNGDAIELGTEPIFKIEVFGNVNQLTADIGNVQVNGDASHIETVSGDISVNGNISADARTMSGNIHCKSIQGNASTMSGNIYR